MRRWRRPSRISSHGSSPGAGRSNCQAENLTRISVDFRSYWGEERWQRFCALKARFDPDGRINAGEVHGDRGAVADAGRPDAPDSVRRSVAAPWGSGTRSRTGCKAPPGREGKPGALKHARRCGDRWAGRRVRTLATLCAQNGLEVALYERERAPRYRIGESLLPATPRQIVPLLGATDEMAQAGFVVKPGGTFYWGDRPEAIHGP